MCYLIDKMLIDRMNVVHIPFLYTRDKLQLYYICKAAFDVNTY